jgi:hypothetical protein
VKAGLSMNWEPVRADHSIDRVVASITLPRPIDANTFDELVIAGRKVGAAHQLTNVTLKAAFRRQRHRLMALLRDDFVAAAAFRHGNLTNPGNNSNPPRL